MSNFILTHSPTFSSAIPATHPLSQSVSQSSGLLVGLSFAIRKPVTEIVWAFKRTCYFYYIGFEKERSGCECGSMFDVPQP